MESKKIAGNYPDDYTFELPEELIAKYPVEKRTHSRLLDCSNLHRHSPSQIQDRYFYELPEILRNLGPLTIVRNSTRVSKRRVYLEKATGGKIEALFLERSGRVWKCLLKKASKVKEEEILIEPITRSEFIFRGRDLEHNEQCILEPNTATVQKWDSDIDLEDFFNICGHVPLPPYMKREDEKKDAERYQTVYAQKPGSVAAPTAGLHFDDALFEELKKDHEILDVYLDVGYGTFAPLAQDNFQTGTLHSESYHIPESTADILNRTDRDILCVGTTSLRTLESNLVTNGHYVAGSFSTALFIYPPHKVRSCRYMITNFHLPASSLFLLAASFSGTENIQLAYRHAVKNRYRFFSYGDATLLSNQSL